MNTGIQIACYPLRADLQFATDQVGFGWQHCRCKVQNEVVQYGYLQWQVLHQKLFLAVDTTVGSEEAEVGYFSKASAVGGEFVQTITGLLGLDGTPLPDIPPLELAIRPATAEGGEPRDIHLVIDFGNSRTGALLVEFRGDTAQEPLMTPLQLVNRYQLDAWDASGAMTSGQDTWWSSSRSHWCTPPYVRPPQLEKIEYRESEKRGIFGGKPKPTAVTLMVTPRTFEDFSMVRLGHEADDLAGLIRVEGESRTSVSSPKRYLWAKDDSWLEGANWYMADPFDRYDPQHHATLLKGPLLRFLPEDDVPDEPKPEHEEAPPRPRHAPRTLMVAALYELLCQTYVYMNSLVYRHLTGDAGRMRLLRSVTLTYPSGMILPERLQLRKQASKAISIFRQTLGKKQSEPELKLSVDEASAVHLTYIWSEVQKLGRKSGPWFSVMGRSPEKPGEAAPETAAEAPPQESSRRLAARPARVVRRPRASDGRTDDAPPNSPEVRIACIDIGGGTTDLMIARYTCKIAAGGDLIEGETLHRDGISIAGDHLVKRLLERIIVPQFVNVVGLETADTHTLFGKEVPANHAFRAQRVHWINRLFVPLAQAYLENAVDVVDKKISHTDPAIVSPEVVQSLQDTINRIWRPGTYNVKQHLGLCYNRGEFEDVVDEVFGDLLFDLCESIVAHKADVVLLAGLPSKLRSIRRLVETYLPLPPSRIIPMFVRYVGTWYPYQSPDNFDPGVIADPKSTVVVGAAVEFLA
ncbi:MAG: virulence factor SrfB, partial [candidate division NC10 bacterium]